MEAKYNLSNTTDDCDLDILDFQIPWLQKSRFTNCDICQKVMPMMRLGSHRKLHCSGKKEVPLICPICGQSFQSKEDLKLHSEIHLSFKCEFCGKCFKEKKDLVRHKTVMHLPHLPKNLDTNEGFEITKLIPEEKYQNSSSTRIQTQINSHYTKPNPTKSIINPYLKDIITQTRPKSNQVQPKAYQIKPKIKPKINPKSFQPTIKPKPNPISDKTQIDPNPISDKIEPKPTQILNQAKPKPTQLEPKVYQFIAQTQLKPRPTQTHPCKSKLMVGGKNRRCDACQMGAFCQNQHY